MSSWGRKRSEISWWRRARLVSGDARCGAGQDALASTIGDVPPGWPGAYPVGQVSADFLKQQFAAHSLAGRCIGLPQGPVAPVPIARRRGTLVLEARPVLQMQSSSGCPAAGAELLARALRGLVQRDIDASQRHRGQRCLRQWQVGGYFVVVLLGGGRSCRFSLPMHLVGRPPGPAAVECPGRARCRRAGSAAGGGCGVTTVQPRRSNPQAANRLVSEAARDREPVGTPFDG